MLNFRRRRSASVSICGCGLGSRYGMCRFGRRGVTEVGEETGIPFGRRAPCFFAPSVFSCSS